MLAQVVGKTFWPNPYSVGEITTAHPLLSTRESAPTNPPITLVDQTSIQVVGDLLEARVRAYKESIK
jgi:hypothetical protein